LTAEVPFFGTKVVSLTAEVPFFGTKVVSLTAEALAKAVL
jgi:hypothetical protein